MAESNAAKPPEDGEDQLSKKNDVKPEQTATKPNKKVSSELFG